MNELKQEAKSETTSPERLEELANLSHTLARVIAANPITPSELLEKLGRKRSLSIQKAVVSNPNTPPNTLLTLGAKFPQQLLKNPVFKLLILENPDIVSKFPVDTLYNLLQQKNIPQFLLESAAKHQDREIAETAKNHVNFSEKINTEWRKIAEDKIASVNKAYRFKDKLVSFGDFTEFLPLDVIALSSNRKLLQSIASNLNTPYKVLELLANDEDMYVRADIAGNKNTPVEILEKLACDTDNEDDDFWIHQFVGGNYNTPINVLNKLAKSKYDDVRRMVDINHDRQTNIQEQFYLLRYCNIDLETINRLSKEEKLVELANSHNETVCKYVAKNSNTPEYILEKLANDKNKDVRILVACNLNTPQHILEKLADDKNENVRAWVAGNSNITIGLLNKLSLDKDDFVRNRVASNQNIPVYLIEQLVQDENIYVRHEAALNSNLSQDNAIKILNKIIEEIGESNTSSNREIRQFIAKNHNTPITILEKLADDRYVGVRATVVQNPNTSIHIIKQLAATDDDKTVIRAILKHPKCSINVKRIIFERLSRSRKPSLARLIVLLNNYADSKLLACNVNSICWLERYAIAQNIQTPTRTLKKLVRDANRIVRAAAIDNLSNRQL